MHNRTAKRWLAVLLVLVLLSACATLSSKMKDRNSRGMRFTHKIHEDEGLGCEDCHPANDEGWPGMPNHDICSTCHDFDMEKPDERCERCHLLPEKGSIPVVRTLGDEIKFTHKEHSDKDVECIACHGDEERRVPKVNNSMEWCMDCHAKKGPELNECSVCHKVLNKDVRPLTRQGVRISHDNPILWEKVHGQESERDLYFCTTCHDEVDSCEKCHTQNPPSSHNMAWRRHSHGTRALWDRQSCSTCHEEDSCVRCHKKTEPASHRGGWGPPFNRHCVNCHYPPSDTKCTICHENIEHPSALASPHNIGIYGECRLCHPGGVPYRAPHIMNTGIRCILCH